MWMTCLFGVLELLPVILSTGLKEDRMSTVGLILSTLKTKVRTHADMFLSGEIMYLVIKCIFHLSLGCSQQGD